MTFSPDNVAYQLLQALETFLTIQRKLVFQFNSTKFNFLFNENSIFNSTKVHSCLKSINSIFNF
jgi:hypothetical protein